MSIMIPLRHVLKMHDSPVSFSDQNLKTIRLINISAFILPVFHKLIHTRFVPEKPGFLVGLAFWYHSEWPFPESVTAHNDRVSMCFADDSLILRARADKPNLRRPRKRLMVASLSLTVTAVLTPLSSNALPARKDEMHQRQLKRGLLDQSVGLLMALLPA